MVGTTYGRITPTGNSTTLSQRHPQPCCQSLCHPAFNMRERHAQQKGQTNCQPGSRNSRLHPSISQFNAVPPTTTGAVKPQPTSTSCNPRNTQIPHTPHTLQEFPRPACTKHNTDTLRKHTGNTHSTHTKMTLSSVLVPYTTPHHVAPQHTMHDTTSNSTHPVTRWT